MGKTSLAIKLCKKFNGEIVSADSRQIYRGLNIGTGKDLPDNAKIKFPWFGKFGYYEDEGIKIWGYDLADPRHEYSVAQYLKFANRIIEDIQKRGHLPVLTGGTGLYLKAVVDGIPTAFIPRNEKLRNNFRDKTADELYETLAQIDSIRAGQMNSSDKKNPRRLVRAIEVAIWKVENVKKEREIEKQEKRFDSLTVGLTAPKEVLDKRIALRVKQRVDKGIIEEIKNLVRRGIKWDSQAMTSIGYGEWKDFIEGKISKEEVIKGWGLEEIQYAKRQNTWFKKDNSIVWFDITDKKYPKNVENMVEKWHNGAHVPQG